MSKFAIAFLLTYLGGVITAIFIDGAYGIFLYVIEYFLHPNIRWWYGDLPDLRYSFIIAICTIGGFLIRIKKYSENHIFDVPQSKWLLALTILMGLVSFIAVWPEVHKGIYINYLKIMAFVFLLYKMIDTPQKFEKIIWAFLIGCFYIGWVAHSMGRTGYGRLEGIGPTDANDANALASVLICSIPILLFYLMKGRKYWHKIISVIFLAFIMDGLVLINSRGAFLGLISSTFYMSYFIFFKRIKDLKFKIKMITGMLFGIILFVYLTDATFWERMKTITGDSSGKKEFVSSGGSRPFFWLKGLEMVNKYPLGVGSWGYHYLSPQFIPEELLNRGMRAPHSTWIEVLVDYGYIGFILFLGFVISNFNLGRKVQKHLLKSKNYYLYYQNVAIRAAFIAYLTDCIFLDRLYSEVMYWFPAFMACFANIYLIKGYSSVDKEQIGNEIEKN